MTLLLIAFNWLVLPDPLYPIYASTFEGGLFDVATRLSSAARVVVVAAVPIGLVLAAGWWIAHTRRLNRAASVPEPVSGLSLSPISFVTVVQITAGYSTRYRYTYGYADYLWTVASPRGPPENLHCHYQRYAA